MKFLDLYDENVYTINDLKNDWAKFKEEEPENHAEQFTTEFYVILMDTINGRNDIEIIGLTPNEICNYILKLKSKLQF